MNTKRDIWICSLLGLGALAVRILLISKGPFSPESLNLALKAEETLDTMQLQYLFGSGYPLTVILTSAAIFLGRFLGIDDPVFAANLMSVYTSAISVPLFYLMVKRLLDVPSAVISAAMFAFCPIYMGVSVYGKGHAPAMMLCFAGLWLLLRYVESRDANHLFFSGLLIGCLGAARMQDMILVVPAAVAIMIMGTVKCKNSSLRKDAWIDVLIFGVTAAVTAMAFHLPYFVEERRADYFAQYQNFRELSASDLRRQNWAVSLSLYHDWFLLNFSVWGLLAAAGGFLVMLYKQWRAAVFCLMWFIFPAAAYLVIDTTIPRFFTILLPPVYIVSGFFLGYGYRRKGAVAATLGTLIAVLITGVTFLNIYPVLAERNRHAYITEYVDWVRRQVPATARIICKDDFIFYEHYGNLATLTRPNPHGGGDLSTLEIYRRQLQDLLDAGVPVYVSGVGLYSYDPGRQVARYLRQHFDLIELGRHPYEVYHAGELTLRIFDDPLFKVVLKK